MVPILCVDVLPVRPLDDDPLEMECLLIRRRDRAGRLGLTLVGGRVRIDERIERAAARHVRETLGPKVSAARASWSRPDRVGEYERGGAATGPHDPAQHAVALSYVVVLEGEPQALGEAEGLEWFSPRELPDGGEFGFGQGEVVRSLAASIGTADPTEERRP